jgi:hypothetical protein
VDIYTPLSLECLSLDFTLVVFSCNPNSLMGSKKIPEIEVSLAGFHKSESNAFF